MPECRRSAAVRRCRPSNSGRPKLFYLPVWAWVILLSIRHGGVRLPLLANPLFPAGGLYGESKSQILDQIGGEARDWVAPYVVLTRTPDLAADMRTAQAQAQKQGLDLPLVAKPDLGCRGAGVRPVRSASELEDYLAGFPEGERLLLQRMVDQEGEAGIFYVRVPGEERGRDLLAHAEILPLCDRRRPLDAGGS
jgi:hypothetical protein